VFYCFSGAGNAGEGPGGAGAGRRRDCSLRGGHKARLASHFARTLWITGIALYLVVMLPWYVAVQLRNPEFFRFFILEHNLARFSQERVPPPSAVLVLPACVRAGH
jgi:hypothetical protein